MRACPADNGGLSYDTTTDPLIAHWMAPFRTDSAIACVTSAPAAAAWWTAG
jgi:hypothetical protein